MARCITVTFLLSGVMLAGMFYVFYSPLPPHLANRWQLYKHNARFTAVFLYSEMQYRLGLNDRMTAMRESVNYAIQTSLTEDDKAFLEIYDTQLNGVSVRIYKPKSAKGELPGLVFFHGGGWIVLSVAAYDGICANIARTTNIIVISVEYRLAPENPFPAGFDDCLQVALYVLRNGGKLGLDTKRIAVGGDSAGGNLAAAVAMKLREDRVKPALKAQLLIYGIYQLCDMTLPSFKMREPYLPDDRILYLMFLGPYFNLTESQSTLMLDKYLTPEIQKKCDKTVDYHLLPKDVFSGKHVRPDRIATAINDDVKRINSLIGDLRAAPMMAEDLRNMPSSFVLATDWDNVRDENLIYAERLKLAGNRVSLLYLPDSFHGILNVYDYEKNGFDAGPIVMNEILTFLEKELK